MKKNKKKLLKDFASDEICPPSKKNSASFFMAGAPGAGKTETAISLIKLLNVPAIRIDPDDIKKWIPEYQGKYSNIFHPASSLGVEKIYDYTLKKKKSIILDTTFADYEISYKNVLRSIGKNRVIFIFYVYQNPELSWSFTLKREQIEGRSVPKKVFEIAFRNSGINVVRIKKDFGDKIVICLIEKNLDATIKKFRVNISAEELENFLKKC